jgi:cytoskeletal protein RodZ
MENVAIIESIGAYLQSVRKHKRLSLEQVSEATRIKVRLLNDIEKDIFTNLGGLGYAKAMIINYAKHLDADQEKIMEIFNEKFDQKPIHISRGKSIQPKKIIIPQNFFAFLLLFIVIVILTSLVIYLYKNEIITWPPFTRLENKIEVKYSTIKPDTTSTLKKLELESIKEVPSTLNKTALQDTTDYLNNLLFKDKDSPLNYEE